MKEVPMIKPIKPCLASDKYVVKEITNKSSKNVIHRILFFWYTNAKPKDNTPIVANIAPAKFGFPTVDIMALYGLFHLTKSIPFIWNNPYAEINKPKIKDMLENLTKSDSLK